MFLINLNTEIVACILSFRKSRHKPNLENTAKYGFPPIWGKKWRSSEHAHTSYPGLFFRPPGFSPYMKREERRVHSLLRRHSLGSSRNLPPPRTSAETNGHIPYPLFKKISQRARGDHRRANRRLVIVQ